MPMIRQRKKAISKLSKDIDKYLESSEMQVSDWLGKVIILFNEEFKTFCSDNGWEAE